MEITETKDFLTIPFSCLKINKADLGLLFVT